MEYIQRLVEKQINKALMVAGAVVIEGPKACGKTSTAIQISRSKVQLEQSFRERKMAADNPYSVLSGETPRLIDEWQLVPDIWSAVRSEVDKRNMPGQYILTGSATPSDDITRHSGAGRFIKIMMKPMSLLELGKSNKIISLKDLFINSNTICSNESKYNETDIIDFICKGGWPINLNLNVEESIYLNQNYLKSVATADIMTVDGVKRDSNKVEALLFSLARNTASYVSDTTLIKDTMNFGEMINIKTLKSYINALKRIWVFVEQQEWGQHLRSSASVRKSPKRHLIDPSLAVAALDLAPELILRDRNTFGVLFESFVWSQISIYADYYGYKVRAYHDSEENEIDIILTNKDSWGAIEVKLSSNPKNIEIYAKQLKKVTNKFSQKPSFMAIITATGPSYKRKEDDIYIINITDIY